MKCMFSKMYLMPYALSFMNRWIETIKGLLLMSQRSTPWLNTQTCRTPPYNCTHTDWLCLKKRTKSVFWKYNFGQKIEKMKIIDPAFFDFSHFLGKKLEKSKKMGKNVKNAVNWQFLPPNCIFSMDDRWHWGSPSIFSFLNPKKLVFGSKRGNFEN